MYFLLPHIPYTVNTSIYGILHIISNQLGKFRGRILTYIFIEHHADRAHEQAPLGADLDAAGVHLDQASFFILSEQAQLSGEVADKINVVGTVDCRKIDWPAAHPVSYTHLRAHETDSY